MHHRQWLVLVDGQCLCGPDGILDLSAVESVLCEIGVVFLRKWHSVNLLKHADALDKELEDCFLGLWCEFSVAEGDVDAGLEGFVEGLDAVSCEEEDLNMLAWVKCDT